MTPSRTREGRRPPGPGSSTRVTTTAASQTKPIAACHAGCWWRHIAENSSREEASVLVTSPIIAPRRPGAAPAAPPSRRAALEPLEGRDAQDEADEAPHEEHGQRE